MTGIPCESLATKSELQNLRDEVQELRNQINTLLGQSEDGSGTIDVLQAGTLEGTQTFALLALAGTAIQKIVIQGDTGRNILEALASGGAKFEAIKGKGVKAAIDSLNNLGKGAAGNLTKIKGLGGAVASNAGAIFNVASLSLGIGNSVIAIGNLKLNDMNQRNNELAFNSLARDYSNMMGFVAKNRSDIRIAQSVNATNQAVIEEQRNVNADQYQQIIEAQTGITSLENTVKQQKQQINKANTTITAYRAYVETLDDDIAEFKEDLTNQAIELESALVRVEQANNEQTESINYLTRWTNAQQAHIDSLELQIDDIQSISRHWQAEFDDLRRELGLIPTPSLLSGSIAKRTIYLTESENERAGSGGGAASARAGTVDSQNGILDLASGLAGTATQAPRITETDVTNRTTTFNDTLTNLISQIDVGGAVQASDIQDIRSGVKADMESVIPALLGLSVVPSLNQLKTQTSAPAIAAATATGVCDSSKPGGCLDTNIKNPLQNQLGNMVNAGGTAFSAANNVILQQMQPVLNGVNSTVNTIKGVVNHTNAVVTHAKHGLEAVQNFASTAWKSIHGDKIMNAVTTTLVVHNAIMLSGNLLQTVGEAASVTLSAIGIKDEEGNPFDVGEIVQNKVTAMLTNYLGKENYEALTQRIAAANRVYQASANVLDTATSLFDSARTIAEVTASNTGKIGNALKESGAVYEDAYDEMLEKVNPQNRAMRRLDRFREGLESIEDGVSSVSSISSEVVEIKENYQQLKTEKKEWKEEATALLEEQSNAKKEAKEDTQVTADVSEADFDAAGSDA